GKVYWTELNTHDVEKAKKFYAATLGWKFEAMPMPGFTYWIIKAGDEVVGGMFELASPEFQGIPEHWLTYIAVDDVDKRAAKAVKAGGKLVRPAFDVPGVGRIAIIMQPGGGGIGWMTPAPM
ncbi:MAG TPA: VOC family protein, partial [Hyphomicrobiaceae bacterium]|nr:VOC family protein [Hyphomicrobiaceae bacterium]